MMEDRTWAGAGEVRGHGWRTLHAGDPYKESPSQTAGPYVHIGCTPNVCGIEGVYPQDLGTGAIFEDGVQGTRILLTGRIHDGVGFAIRDALVELWQADANGLYPSPSETRGTPDPAFRGWGRSPLDPETGRFRFETIKPGRVPSQFGLQAPHATLWIVARGINIGLQTRAYFADEAEANAEDPLLNRIEQPLRRQTLIARRSSGETSDEPIPTYTLDIHLQGERETVFLDI